MGGLLGRVYVRVALTVWLATKVEQEGRTPQHHPRVRKPVDLGTMFKDRVDLLSGHIVFNEVQEGKAGMARAKLWVPGVPSRCQVAAVSCRPPLAS